jgi:hypothetical protein
MTLLNFNPQDWYWYVGGNQSQVYASARNIYVDPTTDSAYLAWAAHLTAPQVINESEIWYYMQAYLPAWIYDGTTFSQPAAGQYSKQQLKDYATSVNEKTANGGCTTQGVPVFTTQNGRIELNSARTAAQADPSYTTTWVGTDGAGYPVTSAAMMIQMAHDACTTFYGNCYNTLATTVTSINSGSITTLAQIDSAFAAIPKVY